MLTTSICLAKTKSDVRIYQYLEQPLPEKASCLIRHPTTEFSKKDFKCVEPPSDAYPWFEQKLQDKLKSKLHLDARLMSDNFDTSTAFAVTATVVYYTTREIPLIRRSSGPNRAPAELELETLVNATLELKLVNSDAGTVAFEAAYSVSSDSYQRVFGKIIDEFINALKIK